MGRKLGSFWIEMIRLVVLLLLLNGVNWAQDAVHEEPRMFGECKPLYSALKDSLLLYNKPNKESDTKVISYGVDWNMPYRIHEGYTRVIKKGLLKAKKQTLASQCQPTLAVDELLISAGQVNDLMFYSGEGYGVIVHKGSLCMAPVHFDFEKLSQPLVQVWLQVLYQDGTSPGWLLHDGSQTKVSGIEC